MPYRDPERQRAYNRRWHRARLELCPLCANLKTPGSELCQECRSHARMAAAELREREEKAPGMGGCNARPHTSRSRSSGRPQPADHPWRKSLTRIA